MIRKEMMRRVRREGENRTNKKKKYKENIIEE